MCVEQEVARFSGSDQPLVAAKGSASPALRYQNPEP